ncbi:VRR-NUC domain-containing protein [Paraburkholderia sp. ZP32-5]|uniref:VRR-NUC domain-containing protein n=1 Tax=Paraburkholderia sp. ZP32-5 TaxID=2883245 RepID=UPI001F191AC6|nr:VRR-NUC domain-containing protein [Paraburkholderia sp. ZP32-5]
MIPVKLRDGSIVYRMMMQAAMSAPMIAQEVAAGWLFEYKAEVSFDMSPSVSTGGLAAPIPFLSNVKPHGTERRRSLNPFPPGGIPGLLRRPDVIIAKSSAILWPGRGTVDREGGAHVDNMLRLVEVKFPGDNWGAGQEEAYRAIAGDFKTRMTVIDVTDCNGDLQRVPVPAPIPAPKTEDEKQRLRAPVRTVPAIPQPVWYEDWWQKAGDAVTAIWDSVEHGYAYVSAETSAFLHQHAPWLFTAGHWIADKASATWTYVSEEGKVLYKYTAAQLKAAWEEIVRLTDLTWQVLKQIDWAQVGLTVLKGIGKAVLFVVTIVVAAVVIIVLLPEELLAALAALVAMIATASVEALAGLATAIGVSAAAQAA